MINSYRHKPLFCAGIIRAVAAADLPSGANVPYARIESARGTACAEREAGAPPRAGSWFGSRSFEDDDTVGKLTAGACGRRPTPLCP